MSNEVGKQHEETSGSVTILRQSCKQPRISAFDCFFVYHSRWSRRKGDVAWSTQRNGEENSCTYTLGGGAVRMCGKGGAVVM